MGTQQINLRLDKDLVSQYQELADNADDRDRSYFMKKALKEFVGSKTPKKPVKRFTPPTVEEVKEYCLSRGNSVDPVAFVSHYKANGCKRGKTPIKDWKACVVTWERKQVTKNTKSCERTTEKSR